MKNSSISVFDSLTHEEMGLSAFTFAEYNVTHVNIRDECDTLTLFLKVFPYYHVIKFLSKKFKRKAVLNLKAHCGPKYCPLILFCLKFGIYFFS